MLRVVALAVLLFTFVGATAVAQDRPDGSHRSSRLVKPVVPDFKRVMIVILENADYDDAIKQPFLASLARRGALLARFSAEAHPSQPNYIALISGSTQGVDGDSDATVDAPHVGDLLEKKMLQWKVYAEDYPGDCFLGSTQGDYVRKHLPFLSFVDVQTNPVRCGRIVDASQLSADIETGRLPTYSLYIPNLDNDGHDTDVAYADQWLSMKFGPLLDDKRFTRGLLFIVTFDESEGGDDESGQVPNHILTVLVGNTVKPGSVSDGSYDHYSLLRLVEDRFDLGHLGLNDALATPIDDVWK